MKKLLGIIALMSTNYVYALSPAALPLSATTLAVNDNSIATTIKNITTLPPIENITVEVNAGSIAGPVKATACVSKPSNKATQKQRKMIRNW